MDNANTASDNGRLILGAKPGKTSKPEITNIDGAFVTLDAVVEYPQYIIVIADTARAEGDRVPATDEATTINLRWQDDKWVLLDFAESKK